jgi:hypothetical protein
MNFSDIELPSNRKFGFFFVFVFTLVSLYFIYTGSVRVGTSFLLLAAVLLIISLLKPEIFLPFNKMWMMLGFALGKIISPLVLGIIFFGLFTPIALCLKLLGRDELRLKLGSRTSHWRDRITAEADTSSFKNQF